MTEKMVKAYMNMGDVEEMYIKLNDDSRKGLVPFMEKAKKLAVTSNQWHYQFKNEDALFELFKEEIPEKLRKRKFTCWGELVQYIS